MVDGIAPTVVSVDAPADGTYVAGQQLDFTVKYSEAVVWWIPWYAAHRHQPGYRRNGHADYISGSGTTALVFRYTVTTGQADPGGVTLAGAIDVNGGAIRDGVGNAEAATLNGVASTTGVHVDAVAPTVSIVVADTALRAGETTQVTFTFSEAVSGLTTRISPWPMAP